MLIQQRPTNLPPNIHPSIFHHHYENEMQKAKEERMVEAADQLDRCQVANEALPVSLFIFIQRETMLLFLGRGIYIFYNFEHRK